MKPTTVMLCAALAAFTATQAQDAKPAETTKPAEPAAAAAPTAVPMDKVSYFIGLNFADNFKGRLEVDQAALFEGIKAGLANQKPKYSQEEMLAAMQLLETSMREKEAAKGGEAKEKGAKFLAENAKKKGVTTTKSGLQYEVIKPGDGPKPAATDTVNVHYHGTLIDGKVFDSSVERGEPVTFPLQQVIKGWTEGLQLMPVGSKWRFYIPSDLAYGEQSPSADIGPNETLIFDVELLGIVK